MLSGGVALSVLARYPTSPRIGHAHRKDTRKIMIPLPTQVDLPDGGRLIAIRWQDGRTTQHVAFDLRAQCPCASCIHEFSGEQLLKIEDVDPNVAASSYHKVGRYALQFQWSDGHSTGIYTYERLRDDTTA